MKLEKFKNIDKKKRFIIIFTVCCVFLLAGVFLYTSFAMFTEEKQFNVINGQVQDPGDLYFAVYIDGQITNTFPKKDVGYSFDASQSSCTNGATVSWDNESWSALINFSNYQAENMSRTKCTVHFKESSFADTILSCSDTAANCIQDNASLSSEIATDDPDGNARYIGANPNNYVLFNNELWRIIGAFKNIDNGSGLKETRLKIIKDEAYSTEIVWNTDRKSNWPEASAQKELNTTYLNNIASPYKEMIGNAVWNLEAIEDNSHTSTVFYTAERGTTVYDGYATTWTGSIGLMYPSDYGYATDGGSTGRDACLSINLNICINSDCRENNWLYDSSAAQWTLTPEPYSAFVFTVSDNGCLGANNAFNQHNEYTATYPAAYLSSNVKITGGTGTSSDPYQLSL